MSDTPQSRLSLLQAWRRRAGQAGSTPASRPGIAAAELANAPRCDAIGAAELAGEMALVGEAAGEGRIGQGRPLGQQTAGAVEAAHHEVVIGTGAEGGTELARQSKAIEPGHNLQPAGIDGLRRMGIEIIARPLQRWSVQARRNEHPPRRDRARARPARAVRPDRPPPARRAAGRGRAARGR